MEWSDVLSGIISFVFSIIGVLVSIVVAPIDLLINALAPGAAETVQALYDWITGFIYAMAQFLGWFFYVLGITPATLSIIFVSVKLLLLIFLMVMPIKVIVSIYRGMRA